MTGRKNDGSRIRIRFYSGYRGAERPAALIFGDREIPVERILSRAREQNPSSGRREDVFRCRAGGKTWTIRVREDGTVVSVTFGASRKT